MGKKLIHSFISKWWLWIAGITIIFFMTAVVIRSECIRRVERESDRVISYIKSESICYDRSSLKRRVEKLVELNDKIRTSDCESGNLTEGFVMLEGEEIPDELLTILNNPKETYMEKTSFDDHVYCYAAKAYSKDGILICYEDVTGRNMTYAEFSLENFKTDYEVPSGYEVVITDGVRVLTATDQLYEGMSEEDFLNIVEKEKMWRREAEKYRNYFIYVISGKEYVYSINMLLTAAMTAIYAVYIGMYIGLMNYYENSDMAESKERDGRIVEEGHQYVTQSLHEKNILLVEWNEFNMGITQCILEKNGARVVRVRDANEAVKIFDQSERNYFAAILVDFTGHLAQGLYLTTQLRELKRWDAREIPVLAMTIYVGRKVSLSDRYVSGWILKPVNEKTLIETIKRYIV